MQTRPLGTTGVRVSLVALGTMTWGQQNTEAEAHAQLDYSVDQGVTLIDTAEMYPVPPLAETQGRTEEILGTWLARPGNRDKVLVATKVTGRSKYFSYIRSPETRLSPEHIRRAVEGSLRRLRTDYIDLYQLHWPDRNTNTFGELGYKPANDQDAVPIADTLGALAELVAAGKIRWVGVSNESPWGLAQYLALADAGRGPRVQSIQNPYNLLNRSFEIGLAEFSHREHVGLLAYSPLAFGTLSGKYLGEWPANSRLKLFDRFRRYTNPQADASVRKIVAVARKHGLDPAQMALAWVHSRPFTTATIIGATTMEQLRANIASADLVLDEAVIDDLEAVHREQPNPAP